jgi:hypothetical protein
MDFSAITNTTCIYACISEKLFLECPNYVQEN